MNRTSLMSTGFLLIFLGIQLHVVESFTMTRRVSNFLSDNFSGDPNELAPAATVAVPNFDNNGQNYNSPYYQASYGNTQVPFSAPAAFQPANRVINPPRWICWPVLFMGAVLILQGLTRN